MSDRDRLIELLGLYLPINVPNQIGSYNTIGERTLNRDDREKLADHLIANGVICPPCNIGDKVYVGRKQQEMTVKWLDCRYGCTVEGEDYKNFRFYFDLEDIGKSVFFSREDAERALEEVKRNDK